MNPNKLRQLLIGIFGEQYEVQSGQFKINCVNPSCDDHKGNLEISLEKSIFHCFSGDTEIITYDGIQQIEALSGKVVKLLTNNGKWVQSPILYFGEQEVTKLTLKRDRIEKVICTTSEHRWFVKKYAESKKTSTNIKEVITDELKIGDRLIENFPERPSLDFKSINANYWVARGFVFGDGSKQGSNKSTAYFCGQKDLFLVPYFSQFGKRLWRDKKIYRSQFSSLPKEFKHLPAEAKLEELYCWLKGYFAADGCVKKTGNVELSSANVANLKYVRNICLKLGIGTFGIRKQYRKGINGQWSFLYSLTFVHFDLDKEFFILPHHKSRFVIFRGRKYKRVSWRVASITATHERKKVYCAIVPETHSFTLDGNILTGNCWKCHYSGRLTKLFLDYLGKVPPMDEYISEKALISYQSDFDEDIKKEVKFRGLPDEFCPLWENRKLSVIGQKALKYALSRMSMEDIERYKVGYCGLGEYRWRIVIPFFEDGQLVYWVARSIYKNEKPYHNPNKERFGMGADDVVFNIDRARELGRAIITEGVFDSIRVGEDGVAILGTEIGDKQVRKLAEIPKLYVFLDEDAILKGLGIAKALHDYSSFGVTKSMMTKSTIYVPFLPSGDPGDWDRAKLRATIDLSQEYDEKLYDDMVYKYL